MFHWRLIFGTLIVAALVGICCLDFYGPRPGIFLLPLAVVGSLLSASEVVNFYSHREHRPIPWVIFGGTLLTVMLSATPMLWKVYPSGNGPIGRLGWLALGMTASLLLALFWRGAPLQRARGGCQQTCSDRVGDYSRGWLDGFHHSTPLTRRWTLGVRMDGGVWLRSSP